MKHIFIVNPHAGQKDAGKAILPALRQAAEDCGVMYEVETTASVRHAQEIAARHAGAGLPVRLYAVGGDGTLNEVFTGAYPYPLAEVASIPCGSGNDFVRSYGTPEDFLNLKGQIEGIAIPIDLMQVDGVPGVGPFTTVAPGEAVSAAITSTGLDAEVAYNIPKYRRIPLLGGTMAYNISILEKLLKPLGKQLQVTIDGKVITGRFLITTVCNGQTYGGGYRAAPNAKLDDGLLDIILVKKVSRLLIAGIIGNYKTGAHMQNGDIIPKYQKIMQFYRGREIEIRPLGTEPFILNVDGECGPAPRLYAKVMPLAAHFVLPLPLAKKLGRA